MPRAAALMFAIALAVAPLGAPARVSADELTIYRCTDRQGRLTLRDTPCAAGERQQAIGMQRPVDPPPSRAAPAALPAPVAPAPRAAAPQVVVVQPRTPMYECVSPDGERYTSHTDGGNPRWVPLWTLGYPLLHGHRPGRPGHPRPPRVHRPGDPPVRPAATDGRRDTGFVFDGVGRPAPRPPADPDPRPALPPSVGLALTPGSWIRDECYPLPHAEVCQRLRDRHWELGRRYNSALQGERQKIDAEQRTLDAQLASECGGR